jgi:hypothetical protein
MFDLRRRPTFLWQAVMIKLLCGVWTLEVPRRALTLIVVDQIMTSSWVACAFWTIRDVLAVLDAINLDGLSEAAVTLATEILVVIARG